MESKLLARWKTASARDQRLFAQEGLILEVSESILEVMDGAKVSKAELANRLDTSKSYITQVLSGTRNLTLRTLADMGWALGREVRVEIGAPRATEWSDAEHKVGRYTELHSFNFRKQITTRHLGTTDAANTAWVSSDSVTRAG